MELYDWKIKYAKIIYGHPLGSNWKSLKTSKTIVNLIGNATTKNRLKIKSTLDKRNMKKGLKTGNECDKDKSR